MESVPLVSIIVPVYNVEKYIRQCVDSLLHQTYRNIEVILVDDGSTDCSGEICDEYARSDSRVIVFHCKNKGAGYSRVFGTRAATGCYALYIDSDDWIDTDTVSSCVELAVSNHTDCVLFPYAREYENGSFPVAFFDGNRVFEKEAAEAVYRQLFGLYDKALADPAKGDSLTSCCMKLYSIDFARRGRYFDTKEVGSGEDALFNIYALHGATSLAYINQPFYHYRRTNNASLTSTYRPKLPSQWGNLFAHFRECITEYGLDSRYSEALSNRVALSIIGLGFNELTNPRKAEQLGHIRSVLTDNEYRRCVKQLDISSMPLIWKVFFVLCKMRCVIGVYLCLIFASKMKGKR